MRAGALGAVLQIAQQILHQVAVRVEHAATAAGNDILEQYMFQQLGLSLPRDTHHIRVSLPLLMGDPKTGEAQGAGRSQL